MRPAVSLALIVLFGPAPFLPLLASSGAPPCQMACCKRLRAHRACSLEHLAAAESAPPEFRANYCVAQCSHAAGMPAVFAAGFPAPSATLYIPRTGQRPVQSASTPRIHSFDDFFLYQRPPPAAFA
jgi:hypothetical protein